MPRTENTMKYMHYTQVHKIDYNWNENLNNIINPNLKEYSQSVLQPIKTTRFKHLPVNIKEAKGGLKKTTTYFGNWCLRVVAITDMKVTKLTVSKTFLKWA